MRPLTFPCLDVLICEMEQQKRDQSEASEVLALTVKFKEVVKHSVIQISNILIKPFLNQNLFIYIKIKKFK